MASIDVTIRGAGAFGLSIAWACARRGACVRVIDPHGVGAGASGGIVGALAPHVPENWNDKKAFQLDSLLMAESWWAEVARIGGGDPGYARSGRLQPIADDHALNLAHARAKGARSLWQGHAQWAVVPARDAGAWEPASPTGWLIHDTLSAHLNPAHACDALARAVRARGGQIVADAPEIGIVIEATGAAGLDALSATLGRVVGQGIKGQAALFDLNRAGAPQLFADGLHVIAHHNGTVAVGSTTERDFNGLETDALLDDVIARARAAVPGLRAAQVIGRWAGLRPRARSRAPMLGRHPLRPDAFIANGGFKIGFGMAPKTAEIIADLVLEGRDAIPVEFAPAASL